MSRTALFIAIYRIRRHRMNPVRAAWDAFIEVVQPVRF